MSLLCKECGNEMRIAGDGISNHLADGLIDYEQDANHVAIADESEQNYISIYGFESESDLENNKETHIDSIAQDDAWEECVLSIIEDNKGNYHHITVQSDDGKPLPSFQ